MKATSLALILLLIVGCSTPPPAPKPAPPPAPVALAAPPPVPPPAPPAPPPKPTILQISLTVSPNANRDSGGRPSPVVARLYELKSLAAFQGADFFALFDRDKETLGNDLVAKEELILQPGDNREFRREPHADTRFIAMVVAYRDIERSRWRASMPVTRNETTPTLVNVKELEILISRK